MMQQTVLFAAGVAVASSLLLALPSRTAGGAQAKPAAGKERFFEMRTYIAAPGKLDALNARFRNHTNRLFEKHGMALVGYWVPADGDAAKNTLVYILAYADREAREKSWKAFQDDPEWKRVKTETEKDGALVQKVESVYLKPTDYSPIR
jgi:hypothetical protein